LPIELWYASPYTYESQQLIVSYGRETPELKPVAWKACRKAQHKWKRRTAEREHVGE